MKINHTLTVFTLLFILIISHGCGPGFDGYQDQYSDLAPVSTDPWDGSQTVYVILNDSEVQTPLADLQTYDFQGQPAVLLSELIISSGITQTPEDYRFDFTATDGYNLLTKREGDAGLLPGWDEMRAGYLYEDSRYGGDLTSGWTEHPWGSALSAYLVKFMNGGTITLIEAD